MYNLGAIEVDKTIYVPFASYGDDGESITMSGLAVGDIKIYKDGSVTQRSSTNGFTLLDTDGTDFDGITGIHGFSIDLSDDSDSSFYAEGSEYWIVVDSVTINTQIVSFVAAIFNIQNRNSMLDELLKGNAHNAKFSVGKFLKAGGTGGGGGTSQATVHSGTAQGSGTGSNQIQLDAGAIATDNIYNGNTINLTGGTGVGQTRKIISYTGSTVTATLDADWITLPDATTTFDIIASSSSINSDEGLAQAGAASSITLQSTASANDDIYNGSLVSIIAGTGSGQTEKITDYNGTTKVADISPATWSVNPDSTSSYVVIPAGDAVTQTAGAPTVGQIVSASWDETMANHLTEGTTGEKQARSDRVGR